ncbi:MAG: hypothetical protein LAO06_01175 [Acidobacteriia bacterium]|nr:hypothetical protein [Terriglobia bacterium]
MPENNAKLSPTPNPNPSTTPAKPQVVNKDADNYDRAHVPMGEEFDKAKWTLPPWQPVVIALAVVAVVVAILSWVTKAKPQGKATIDNVNVVQIQGDNVLVAVNVSLNNSGRKPLWIHDIKAQLKTDKGDFSDEAAPAVDVERYYQAFPDLKQNTLPALLPEAKVAPGGEQKGTIVFSFPVTKDQFEKRKTLTVTIQPYEQKPVVLTK